MSVIVPTYRRAESLRRCLEGLQDQVRSADEVLVIVQAEDKDSLELLEHWSGPLVLKVIQTPFGGQVNQLNRGLEASLGDVIAITDDDAVPQPEWLQRIERHFAENPDLGGVGGRDLVWEQGLLLEGDAGTVGTVQWFGRVVGNHHIGTRLLRDVNILKGANMSFRAAAVQQFRFDSDLRGAGAQTCNDMAFSLGIQSRGWRLLFDPEVAIDHFPAQRFDLDQRGAPSLQAIEDRSFNFLLALHRHMKRGLRRRMALTWALVVGAANTPGIVRGWLYRIRGDEAGVERRLAAKRAWRAAKRSGTPIPAPEPQSVMQNQKWP